MQCAIFPFTFSCGEEADDLSALSCRSATTEEPTTTIATTAETASDGKAFNLYRVCPCGLPSPTGGSFK